MVITNVSLSIAAMVGAVQVVTEAKTGVLRDHGVRSRRTRSLATGTGTDVVVIAGAGAWRRTGSTIQRDSYGYRFTHWKSRSQMCVSRFGQG